MIEFEVTNEQVAEFHREGYIIVRGLFDEPEMAGLLGYAKKDQTLADESYVRRDAAGAETRLSLRNDLDEASVYTAIVRSQRGRRCHGSIAGR